MGGLFTTLGTAGSSLRAHQTAIQTVAHNVANADTVNCCNDTENAPRANNWSASLRRESMSVNIPR